MMIIIIIILRLRSLLDFIIVRLMSQNETRTTLQVFYSISLDSSSVIFIYVVALSKFIPMY